MAQLAAPWHTHRKQITNQWNAAEYDAKHAFVYEKARGLVELRAPKAGERILDLGCGTGALTAEIAARGAEVLGVDRSEEMIAQARKKNEVQEAYGQRFKGDEGRSAAVFFDHFNPKLES